jgi:hypothetical protein
MEILGRERTGSLKGRWRSDGVEVWRAVVLEEEGVSVGAVRQLCRCLRR